MSDRQAWWLGFLGTFAVVLGVLLILAAIASAQPQQGFGPTFDPSNLALRVNVVAGSAGGLSPSTFGTAFPSQGAAVGGKDPNGSFASLTISNTGRLQVTCDNCSSSAATFGTAYPSSGGAIGYKDTLGAFASVTGSNGGLNVNVLSGGGGSSTYGTAFPSSGSPTGFKDSLGAFASVTTTSGLPIASNALINVTKFGNDPVVTGTGASGAGIPRVTVSNDSVLSSITNAVSIASGSFVNLAKVGNNPIALGQTTSASSLPVVIASDQSALAIASFSFVNVAKFGNDPVVTGTGASGAGIPRVTVSNDSVISSITNSVTVTGTITANQGASASVANAWPIIALTDSGLPVRYGDDSNKAIRVNIVAGSAAGGTSSNYGTAFPGTGTPGGGKDANGAFASFNLTNGRLQVTCDNCSSSSATYGTAFPSSGGAIGYKDANGAFASNTGTNGSLNVNVTNSVTVSGTVTANQGSSASISNAWPVIVPSDGGIMVRPGDDTNKAIRVNVVAGGTTNSSFGTAFPTTGIAAGYKDANGAFASFTGSNGKQNVIVGNESNFTATLNASNAIIGNVRTTSDSTLTATVTQSNAANLNATVTQGASASVANAWPIVNVSDAGVMVRAGDETNKALRVNVVAGSSGGVSVVDSAAFTAASSVFVPGGGVFNDSVAPLTSGTQGTQRLTANRAAHENLRDSAGRELGTSLPGVQTVPVMTQPVPQLPTGQVSLGAKQTTIVNVPQGQAPSTPLRGVTVGGGLASQGWVQPWVRCDRTASVNLTNTGMTQVVGAVNGQQIYVCGYTMVAGTTPVGIGFSDGTGSNCGTSSSDLTGSMAVAASGGMVNSNSQIPYFETRPGNALCVKLSNGASVGGHLRYSQF